MNVPLLFDVDSRPASGGEHRVPFTFKLLYPMYSNVKYSLALGKVRQRLAPALEEPQARKPSFSAHTLNPFTRQNPLRRFIAVRPLAPVSYQQHNHNKMSHSELAASYAALILADDEVEVTVRPSHFLQSGVLSNAVRPRSF